MSGSNVAHFCFVPMHGVMGTFYKLWLRRYAYITDQGSLFRFLFWHNFCTIYYLNNLTLNSIQILWNKH
jgi:hypothetical protein